MGNKKTRAAVYIRRSDKGQAETPAVQLDLAIRKAAEYELEFDGTPEAVAELIGRRGGRLGDVFLDEDVSGSVLERPGLNELLRAFGDPNSEYGILVAFRRDRLARPNDPLDGAMIDRVILGSRATLVFNDQTVSPAKNDDEQIYNYMSAILGYSSGNRELKAISQRTLAAKVSRATRGASGGGRAPYGFQRVLVDPSGRVVRELADGEIVRQEGFHVSHAVGDEEKIRTWVWMLERKLETWGYKRIATELNRRGIPSPDAGRTRRDNGILHLVSGLWSGSTVRSLCKNKRIIGLIEFGRSSEGKFNRFAGEEQKIREVRDDDRNAYTGELRRIENDRTTAIVAPAAAEPQFDASKWEEIQGVTNARSTSQLGIPRGKDPATYPLSCRVVDLTEGCGAIMYGKTRKRKKKGQAIKDRQYCCGRYMAAGGKHACYNNTVDAERLLSVVLGVLARQVERLGLEDEVRRRVEARMKTRRPAEGSDGLKSAQTELIELKSEAETVAANLARESDEELRDLIRADWERLRERKRAVEARIAKLERLAADRTPAADRGRMVQSVLDDLASLADNDAARRRIGLVLRKLDVWVGLDFEEAVQGKKRKVRRLKHGRICVGKYDLPVPLRGEKAQTTRHADNYDQASAGNGGRAARSRKTKSGTTSESGDAGGDGSGSGEPRSDREQNSSTKGNRDDRI